MCIRDSGWITGWEEEWLGWRLDSRGAQPGAEGFVHAKKDGKTYAVRIVVTGYPISAYTKTPRFGNMAAVSYTHLDRGLYDLRTADLRCPVL